MVALLALLLGPAVAKIVGPYAIIIIGASTGAAWALSRRDPRSRLNAFWFFVRLNVTALLLSVPLAMLARHWGAPVDPQWLIVPIAILIGGVGDDWPKVGRFVVERMGRLVDRKIDNVGSNGDREENEGRNTTRGVGRRGDDE